MNSCKKNKCQSSKQPKHNSWFVWARNNLHIQTYLLPNEGESLPLQGLPCSVFKESYDRLFPSSRMRMKNCFELANVASPMCKSFGLQLCQEFSLNVIDHHSKYSSGRRSKHGFTIAGIWRGDMLWIVLANAINLHSYHAHLKTKRFTLKYNNGISAKLDVLTHVKANTPWLGKGSGDCGFESRHGRTSLSQGGGVSVSSVRVA